LVRFAILGILKDDYMITSEDAPRIELDRHKHVADELERMMHGKGMKQKKSWSGG
jgi:hypothetical protein